MADCPNCEYHKDRAARWRAEAYKQAGHDVIELPWVGLTDEEIEASKPPLSNDAVVWELAVEWAQSQLKEKNT